MKKSIITVEGVPVELITLHTAVVGSGAAGLCAAARLRDFGVEDIALLTEGLECGTSLNTGSDKQTYYKLTLAGNAGDSPREMARTLFEGGAMQGDIALCEAAMSTRCFHYLAELGVPFPHNQWGEYVGYKTDHDPRSRATSAGPLTSRYMTEALQKRVKRDGTPIFGSLRVIALLKADGACTGLLAIDSTKLNTLSRGLVAFRCANVILAVGGAAGLWEDSVYPTSQRGGLDAAFEAGASGVNLTEWQFGIASTGFRWNLSGSYQQVLPRYLSTDRDGGDEREFLGEYFNSDAAMLNAVFLKGYQWPFDARKTGPDGSSRVDMAVYDQIHRHGRRVFLDYTRNPTAMIEGFTNLGPEALQYLQNSGATQLTPYERLQTLNAPAAELYRGRGYDLAADRLEIAVCAQHNNGGLEVDTDWQTTLPGLYAVGECAGTHGVTRPGGSALNSSQVGATRAAMAIAMKEMLTPQDENALAAENYATIAKNISLIQRLSAADPAGADISALAAQGRRAMSRSAGILREAGAIQRLINETRDALRQCQNGVQGSAGLPELLSELDILKTREVYLAAMLDYIQIGGLSRGSCLILDGDTPRTIESSPADRIQRVWQDETGCHTKWQPVRPIPEGGDWFETVWREYRNKMKQNLTTGR